MSLAAMCFLAIAGIFGAGLCAWQLAVERGSSVAWGQFTAESVRCHLRTCYATGNWVSDDGAIGVADAQLPSGDLVVGGSSRAGIRWGDVEPTPHDGMVVFTEYSAAARQWMLVVLGAALACAAPAPLLGELKLRRRLEAVR